MTLPAPIENFSHHLSLLLIPHHRNNHHPWATRHQGLLLFALGIFISQIMTNTVLGKSPFVLGFATNIQKEELISLTNKERVAQGKGSLTESPQLSQAALMKAQDMFAKNYWAHVAPDGTTPWHFFNLVGYKYLHAGENLARGFDTSSGVVKGWMDSPSHRDNLLNSTYQHIGMAVVNGQLGGEATTLVVQLFGASVSGASTAPATPTKPAVQTPPTPTPRPTLVGVASQTASLIMPVEPSGQFTSPVSPTVQAPAIFKPTGSLNPNQMVLLLSLMILGSIFLVDALILIRKKLLHQRPHALLHAMVILSLIGFLLLSGKGAIL
jgi:hypothetical protein